MSPLKMARSIGSGVLEEDQERVLHVSEPAREKATRQNAKEVDILTRLENASITDLLGGEKSILHPDKEKKGVQDMLNSLTVDEKKQMPDICMPIRHFRAEKGDTKKAVEKLRGALQWRQQFGVNDLLTALPPCKKETLNEDLAEMLLEENETGKIYVRGYDRQGRALMYMRPARENTNNETNNMRHLVWNLEKAIACTARQSLATGGVVLEKVNLVIDYEGFTLRDAPPLSTSRYTLDILQKHYPERMFRAYVLNPPLVFKVFWNIVRPFVDPTTKEKIVFCSGKSGMQKLIDAVEDVHKLEAVAGGTDPVRDFVSIEYMNLPFDVGFDE